MCAKLKFTDAERGSFDASVGRFLCEMRKDLNEMEKELRCPVIPLIKG